MSDIIPSISIEAVVAKRDEIARRITEATAVFGEAVAIGKSMTAYGLDAALSLTVSSWSHRAGWFGDPALAETLIRDVDRRLWAQLLDKSGMRSFMDAEARAQFAADLEKNAPPLTVENVRATFAQIHEQRGDLFERGVINVFRRRSWCHKTNSPRAFGKRLILTRAVDKLYGSGCWSLAVMSGAGDAIDDLLRVLAVLAGHPEPDHRHGVNAQVAAQTWRGTDVAVVGIVGLAQPLPLIDLRAFKNGNLHARFVRPDLVDKLNRIVAKHHPHMLPPADEASR